MAGKSKIEWTEQTWNPVRGCTRVSRGCGGPGPYGGCYAESIAARFSGPGQPYEGLAEMRGGKARWTGKLSFSESVLLEPLKRRKPTTYFVNSMSDLFHDNMPEEWIDRVFAVMALCPQHTFQVLTKRPERMRAYLVDERVQARIGGTAWLLLGLPSGAKIKHGGNWRKPLPLRNVWLGTSCEDQATADARIPELLATPAAVRFVSAEPLLGPIDFGIAWHGETALGTECWGDCGWCENGRPPLHNCQRSQGDWERGRSGLDWVIVGGESGPQARPMHPAWAREIRDQCAAADVAFFMKQWGEWLDEREATARHLAPGPGMFDRFGSPRGPKWHPYEASDRNGGMMIRVGKKAAGRLLDGVEHNGMPEVRV